LRRHRRLRYCVIECKSDGFETQCSTDQGGSDWLPKVEVCNGLDDDCNNLATTDSSDKDATCTMSALRATESENAETAYTNAQS
jgi:hypothetical protein